MHYIIGLLRIFDDADVLHGRFEVTPLVGVLNATALDALRCYLLALTGDENDRCILLGGGDGSRSQVGHAWPLISHDHSRLAGHAPQALRHEGTGFLVVRRYHSPAA